METKASHWGIIRWLRRTRRRSKQQRDEETQHQARNALVQDQLLVTTRHGLSRSQAT
jgi:hypothetical protein